MKKLALIGLFALTLMACAVDGTAIPRPGPDPCAPFWDTPEAYCGDGDSRMCFFDDGRVWARYADGTRILFARWKTGPDGDHGALEGQMCYVRPDGTITLRQSREDALASLER